MSEDELRRVTSERDLAVERFVLMCTAMNQAVWDWDMRANTVWYADAIYSVYGVDPTAKHTFERWTTYVHPDDRERVVAGFRRVVEAGGNRWSDEYRYVRPDNGKVLEVVDRGFVMFEEGRPVRMVGAVMDVTQQRALERQLLHAQRMQAMGQLAGGIAHDFNNLLQAAKLEVDLLLRAPSSPLEVVDHAKEIGSALDRAASLTRQLLVFSRLEAMRVKPIDINAKIGELATMLRRLLGENVELVLELAAGVVSIDADASMLDQVLVNLAVNARDAMTGTGTLSIATSRCGHLEPTGHAAGRYICIEVRDTGAGIASDVLPRIFDPFFTTKHGGTGLGLATVYGIVEQHRGWIDVESELGRGTRFRVYLPERATESVPEAASPERDNPRGTEKILLVEDDDSVRRALSRLLESHGYDMLAVDSGAAALAAWEAAGGEIDLVVTDLRMAGMSGRELAAQLSTKKPGLAILLMSGNRDLEPSNTYELLRKPFDSESLLAAVRACLDRSRASRITR